jgi:hypothetical protein
VEWGSPPALEPQASVVAFLLWQEVEGGLALVVEVAWLKALASPEAMVLNQHLLVALGVVVAPSYQAMVGEVPA